MIPKKVEEHEYHTNRPKVSNSLVRNWAINDGNSRKLQSKREPKKIKKILSNQMTMENWDTLTVILQESNLQNMLE